MDHYIHDPTKKDDIPSELAVEFVVFRGYVAKIISHCATLKGKKKLLTICFDGILPQIFELQDLWGDFRCGRSGQCIEFGKPRKSVMRE